MKTLGKYAVSGFIGPFFSSLAVFSLFMFFGAAFEKLGLFSRVEDGVGMLFRFLAFQTPFFISMLVPLAALIGILFLISELMSTGQWKALVAGGYRPFDIIKPVIFFSLLIAVSHFLFNEFAAAPAYLRSKAVYNEQFRKDKNWRFRGNSNGSFRIKDVFVKYSSYNPLAGGFRGVLVEFYDGGRGLPLKKIKAEAMSWDETAGLWILKKPSVMEYRGGEVEAGYFETYRLAGFPSPRELVADALVDNGTGFFDLLSRISKMRKMGIKTDGELIALNARLSQPLSSLVMVFIGCAIMLSGLVFGKVFNIGVSIFTGFSFWSFTVMSERMAQIGVLGPFLGCFLPHLVFLSVALFSLKRSRAF